MRRIPHNNILEFRRARVPALSQEDLGTIVGLAGSEIGKIERGNREPTLPNAMRIAQALGKSFEDVFFGHRDASLRFLAYRPERERACDHPNALQQLRTLLVHQG